MKPEFMRLRRALAGTVAALLIAAGLVVLSPALSASAHHNTINVSASCVNYQWTITWKITNSEYDKSEEITSSSDPSIIATGDTIQAGSTYTKTETVTGPVTKTLAISAEWSNGVTNSNSRTIYPGDFAGTCERPDIPTISIAGESCDTPSTRGGTISFNLSGVTKTYTVTLDGTTKTTTSTGGSSIFLNVPPGTYTVTATTPYGPSVTSDSVTLTACLPAAPVLALTVAPCVTGGSLGAVTASLSNLALGSSYDVRLFTAAGAVLDTLSLAATSATATLAFPGHGPGTYYATVTGSGGALLATSSSATITECGADFAVTVQLEPCDVFQTGTAREISVAVEGMAASTVYTVRLVTADAAETEIASTTTPGDSVTTFTHTFTGVPIPGDYKVLVLAANTATLASDTITAGPCDLDTLAPPSIELVADQCDGSGTGIGALSARMIDLDATKTYYVRIVDGSGATVTGGEDQTVTGATTATVKFPDVTAPGTYTAQLLIDPGKQLAATSPSSVGLNVCLPTLAMTGPGVLVPLGSVAALLLTLGGAVVMGRLRRRMAL